MGMGDVKLAAVMGLFLGRSVGPALFVGFAAGALAGMAIMAARGAAARKQGVPFAPFLALGGIVGLLFGSGLIDWYVDVPGFRPEPAARPYSPSNRFSRKLRFLLFLGRSPRCSSSRRRSPGVSVVAALGVHETLELASIEEDPATFGALVDDHVVALVGAHLATALRAREGRRLAHCRNYRHERRTIRRRSQPADFVPTTG